MPKLVISSGHGHFVRGASGYLDEVTEARRVVERVAESLRELGIEVETFHGCAVRHHCVQDPEGVR